jgi:hypothetical protein
VSKDKQELEKRFPTNDITVDEAGLDEAERALQTIREQSKKEREEKEALQDLVGALEMLQHQSGIDTASSGQHQKPGHKFQNLELANAQLRLKAILKNEEKIVKLAAKIEAVKSKMRLRAGMY